MRIVTIGACARTGAPLAATIFATESTWSSWMSNSIRFGRSPPPITRSCPSRVSRVR
ncbi:hypothetical protein [Oleiharenicola sp. Vm1]|uniref:hypothetical protein n=1 Tax=Oleiharenicola sp. Vm1 TaxID=3398393 RepID=UPI0039F62BE3